MKSAIYRDDLKDIKPYKPGLTIEEIKAEYGLDRVIKLASNENPLGISPMAQKAIARQAAMAFRYPQNHNPALCEALASSLGVDPGRVVAGNGSDEILDILVRLRCRPGQDHVLTCKGSFSMYPMLAKMAGVECRTAPRNEDHTVSLENIAAAADENTALVFVANPDNPTGWSATADQVAAFVDALPETALVVMDQAYIEFATPEAEYDLIPMLEELPNLVLTRTFSKALGAAGLRLGYGIVPQWLGQVIRKARIPFSVNVLAEAGGLAALEDEYFQKATMDAVLEGRDHLARELGAMGCEVWPTQANFLMFKPEKTAGEVFQALLERGVIVRPLASFGMPDNIRVNVGTPEENKIFIETLKEVLHG